MTDLSQGRGDVQGVATEQPVAGMAAQLERPGAEFFRERVRRLEELPAGQRSTDAAAFIKAVRLQDAVVAGLPPPKVPPAVEGGYGGCVRPAPHHYPPLLAARAGPLTSDSLSAPLQAAPEGGGSGSSCGGGATPSHEAVTTALLRYLAALRISPALPVHPLPISAYVALQVQLWNIIKFFSLRVWVAPSRPAPVGSWAWQACMVLLPALALGAQRMAASANAWLHQMLPRSAGPPSCAAASLRHCGRQGRPGTDRLLWPGDRGAHFWQLARHLAGGACKGPLRRRVRPQVGGSHAWHGSGTPGGGGELEDPEVCLFSKVFSRFQTPSSFVDVRNLAKENIVFSPKCSRCLGVLHGRL